MVNISTYKTEYETYLEINPQITRYFHYYEKFQTYSLCHDLLEIVDREIVKHYYNLSMYVC